MSKNCKEHIRNYSVENFVASFKKMLEDIPEKNTQKKTKNKNYFISILLFIFYSSFYLSVNNYNRKNATKMKWLNLIHKPSLLNFFKFIFKFSIYFVFVLSFPIRLLMLSFLTCRSIWADGEI